MCRLGAAERMVMKDRGDGVGGEDDRKRANTEMKLTLR